MTNTILNKTDHTYKIVVELIDGSDVGGVAGCTLQQVETRARVLAYTYGSANICRMTTVGPSGQFYDLLSLVKI